jgi:uncharacterized protein
VELPRPELLDSLRRQYDVAAEFLPPGTEWFDAHTHIGADDPDGFSATAEEVLFALDLAGHRRALVFPMQEPDGYPAANDRVIAEAAASGGRLAPLCRLDPHADPLPEARRCLAAGARGFKLHPRAECFELHHPEVERIVALAGEHGLPVLVHAGRGIPALGRDAVVLARAHPRAWIILAHAGISDLGWIWREAAALPNLLFDTAWWSMADVLALFALVPPGRLLYASDTPYGFGLLNGLLALRAGRAVGLGADALGQIVGGQVARMLDGEAPADLGPAPGAGAVQRGVSTERVVAHLYGAINRCFVGADPTEPLALAALACEVPPDAEEAPVLAAAGRLIALAARAQAEALGMRTVTGASLAAAALAGTPMVPVAA